MMVYPEFKDDSDQHALIAPLIDIMLSVDEIRPSPHDRVLYPSQQSTLNTFIVELTCKEKRTMG